MGRSAGRGRLAGGSVRRILRPGLVPGLPRIRPGRMGRPAPRLASPQAGEVIGAGLLIAQLIMPSQPHS